MSLDTDSRSFCPCIIRENLARLVFSQSCSEFFSVVDFRFAIIWLRLFFSSSSSPCASTAICLLRSPRATAVATSAIARTCTVRLFAIAFTLSVSAFHVPAAPGTSAWPPSFPSVPTSFATRVTSSAKTRSESTIALTVFFSSRISPRTSTVIFCDRSPFATAVVTRAMFLT